MIFILNVVLKFIQTIPDVVNQCFCIRHVLLFIFSGNFTAYRFAERYGNYIEEGTPSSKVTQNVLNNLV